MATATSIRCKESFTNGTVILRLEGCIDSALALDFLIARVGGLEARNIVVVLDGVDYINSEGFGALIRFSDKVTSARRSLYVVGLQAKVRVVFDTLGVGNMLNVLPTLDDAMNLVRSSSPSASHETEG